MDRKIYKYGPIVLLVVIALVTLIPKETVVRVVGISSGPQEYGPPLVQATLVNDGSAVDVSYWIAIPGRSGRLCSGIVALGDNERKPLRFACPGLSGYAGDFTLETGPAG